MDASHRQDSSSSSALASLIVCLKTPAPVLRSPHEPARRMGGASASAEASKSECGSDTRQLLLVALMGFAKGSTHPAGP